MVVAFGDSLSDVGRGEARLDPQYFNGRYCDGPIWIDYLCDSLKARASNTLTNFAHGGSTTDSKFIQGVSSGSGKVVLGVKQQIATYLDEVEGIALEVKVHSVWAGLNDFWLSVDRTGSLCDAVAVAANTARNAVKLCSAGASSVLVGLQLDLSLYPAFIEAFPHLAATLRKATQRHNEALKQLLTVVNDSTASEIIIFDPNEAVNKAMEEDPELFLADRWHPRTHLHKYIADVALRAINS